MWSTASVVVAKVLLKSQFGRNWPLVSWRQVDTQRILWDNITRISWDINLVVLSGQIFIFYRFDDKLTEIISKYDTIDTKWMLLKYISKRQQEYVALKIQGFNEESANRIHGIKIHILLKIKHDKINVLYKIKPSLRHAWPIVPNRETKLFWKPITNDYKVTAQSTAAVTRD